MEKLSALSAMECSGMRGDRNDDNSKLLHFYRKTCILITGGTGFLGKFLLQKLLSTTELQIQKIYLMMRPKNNQNVEERLKQIFQEKVNIMNTSAEANLFDLLKFIFIYLRSLHHTYRFLIIYVLIHRKYSRKSFRFTAIWKRI